jgi:hypothetical protein
MSPFPPRTCQRCGDVHTSKHATTLHNRKCRLIIVARLASVLELPLAPLVIAGPGGLEVRHGLGRLLRT